MNDHRFNPRGLAAGIMRRTRVKMVKFMDNEGNSDDF